MAPSNEEVIRFLQQRIKHLKELRAEHNIPIVNDYVNDYIDDKLEMFMHEYKSLTGDCVHMWVVTQMDKDGDWIESECVDCGLLKTNS